MKDLDFDELDRAVNSLMSGTKQHPPSSPYEAGEKTLDITPTLDENEKPSFDTIEKAAEQPTPPPSPPTPPEPSSSGDIPVASSIAARRGGRFMDVVHPSSDMKKQAPPSSTVSRRGVTIEPQAKVHDMSILPPEPKTPVVEPPEASLPKNTTVAAAPEGHKPTQPEPVAHPDAVSEWPDPLEMANFDSEDTGLTHKEESPKAPEPPVPAEEPATGLQEKKSPDSTSLPNHSAPLVSPFLPDAKVEKRPLGGITAGAEEPDHTPVVASLNTETSSKADDLHDDQLPALPEDVAPTLPEELRSDLMAIEAGADKEDTPAPSAEIKKDQPSQPERAFDETNPHTSTPSHAYGNETSDTKDAISPTGPTSIPQQYREEKTTGEQESGAIYDTSAYHQPLAHPAKAKSGWLWVVWIVAILLIGAGAGAGLYFLGVV